MPFLQFFARPALRTAGLGLWLALACALPGHGAPRDAAGAQAPKARPATELMPGEADYRLLEVFKLIGQSRNSEALEAARRLVQAAPNFQLAQLVYGDLLVAQSRPLRPMGERAPKGADPDSVRLLREEAMLRLAALKERPPAGAVPQQLLQLSAVNRHVIAVDASRHRLYLFENRAGSLRLAADYYVSVGKLGFEKQVEGDQRTPIGVYFVTSRLDPKQLTDFYGAGALPLNYPNEYDKRRGKSGKGIWLHGVPSAQFTRAPRSTDGCVALSNIDLKQLLETVEPRTTPVLIAPKLDWRKPEQLEAERLAFLRVFQAWRDAKSAGNLGSLLTWYSPQFKAPPADLAAYANQLKAELKTPAPIQVKDLSFMSWRDQGEIMVVTFGELRGNAKTGVIRRQYWARDNGQWKIFFEGVIG